MKTKQILNAFALLALSRSLITAAPLGTAFTYQGKLNDGGSPANGNYDLKFTLFDTNSGGSAITGPLTNSAVLLSNGLFTTMVEFSPGVFTGNARWLEIGVRTNGSGAFTPLSPRQPLTAAPYALYAPNAGLLNGQDTNAFAPAVGSAVYVAKVGDTMTGTLRLPADSLIAGTGQLALTNGNVGLGTLTPSEQLEVAGNLRYSGQLSKLDVAENWEANVHVADFKLGHSTRRGSPGIALGDGWPNLFLNYNTNWPNTVIESKVGIQTRTPAAELDVNGTVRTAALEGRDTALPFRLGGTETMRLERDSAGPWLRLTGPGGWGALSMLDLATYDPGTNAPSARIRASDDFWSSSLDVLLKQPGANTNALVSRLRLRPNGNVMLDPPSSNDGSLTPGLIFGEDFSGEGIASKRTAGDGQYSLSFYTAYSNRLTILNNGNVGIGTPTPTAMLDVNGTITAAKFVGDGSELTGLTITNTVSTTNADTLDGLHATSFWQTSGNAAASSAFLGTTNNQALTFKVNGLRALLLQPTTNSPNVVGGDGVNTVVAPASGVVIAGGGAAGNPNVIVQADYTTISGGIGHAIGTNSTYATIGGGWANTIQTNSEYAGIHGGEHNLIEDGADSSTIGGGGYNATRAYAWAATIAGGALNAIYTNSSLCTISGGGSNVIGDFSAMSVIAGGENNKIAPNAGASAIGGGTDNRVFPWSGYAVIAGGERNTILDNVEHPTISGGDLNTIEKAAFHSVIGGGQNNTIRTNATWGTIPGGFSNSVAGASGFAAGQQAQALHLGSFVWADSSSAPFSSVANNEFSARAVGGVRFVTAINPVGGMPTAGVFLAANGTAWGSLCDRNAKKDLQPVDPVTVLEQLAGVPVQRWHYRWEDGQAPPHLGPMAQDFKRAFYPGRDDTVITTLEFDGVALAAIQGLNQKVETQEAALCSELKTKDARITALEQDVAELKALVRSLGGKPNGGAQ